MDGCHPMFDDACGCTCEAIVGLSDLQLPSICLSTDGRQRKSRVELFPEIFPKGADKSSISIRNNGRQEAIMFPHMFKEELSSLLRCCSFYL